MECTPSYLSYDQTGFFSKMVLDYISQDQALRPFYRHPVSIEGIKASIADREKFHTNRELLVNALKRQYASITMSDAVLRNIELLNSENTFTICTAHQPNIFTGPLYFVYKILHVVKIAFELKTALPGYDFVPVYYMGSEDADLEELGHIYIKGEKFTWETSQAGAVGRMKVDKQLVNLLQRVSGQLSVYPHGREIISLMQACYREGATIEQATFEMVNRLFEAFGLVILLPDRDELKAAFLPVIEKELLTGFSHLAVEQTVAAFPPGYKAQASGRALNLFYLEGDKRERIEQVEDRWQVMNTDLGFSKEELLEELKQHPGRFSPNVILRPLFQEWILPNIAFIGGGGEIAYWLQLGKVFESAMVPYPLLVLRNSFLLASREQRLLTDRLQIDDAALFQNETELINQLVKRETTVQLSLEKEQQQLTAFYRDLEQVAGNVDPTLRGHTAAMRVQASKKLAALEKKMLRAEKRKFEAEQRKLHQLKEELFPHQNLQERTENLMRYYAAWGSDFIQQVYKHSLSLEQRFEILEVSSEEPD